MRVFRYTHKHSLSGSIVFPYPALAIRKISYPTPWQVVTPWAPCTQKICDRLKQRNAPASNPRNSGWQIANLCRQLSSCTYALQAQASQSAGQHETELF